ncbi:MAG TPA: BatA domain-containing protein, partial [Myxococcota bacterium]|nr:BatA domain-containing protein [Myxococcota bacterium]
MSFAAPWFLAGLAAAGLPVAIHLLNRRSARVVAFPATELLLATRRRTARRLQLRQLLLLIVRTALLALVPLMLARPYVAGAARAVRAGGPEVVGVVLDDSLSMRAAPDGATSWFDRARDAARGVVAGLGAEDAALLVLGAARAAGPAAPVDEPSFEHARVEDAIARAAPSALPGDLAAAVARAQALVAASPLPRKRVVVVTDGSAVGWPEAVRPEGGAGRAGGGASAPAASAERSLAVPGIALDVIDVSGGGPRDNVAVVDVVTEPAPSVGPRAYRIAATLANLGTAPLAGLEVDLRLEGATVATGFADLPAGGRVEKVFHHEMERPGLFAGEVALGGALDAAHDVLRDDDVRAFALVVHPAVRTLLVNGDPSTVTYRDELFYLEKALAPGKAARARIDPTVVTLDRVDDVALDRFDVVVLANVPALPAAVVSALVDFVARGGGVLLAAGARLSPAEWSLAMAELAPRGVRALKTVRAVGAEGSAPGGGRPVRMVRPAAGHPIFATFATGLSGAETWEYALAETDASDRSTVLLSFDDGAPALLERHIGAGSVLFLATTVDHDWSDLCIRPGFLPLMQATVLYLARSAPRAESG